MSPTGVFPRPPLHERLWPKIDATGDCWLWTGTTSASGYGRIKRPDGTSLSAHRAVWNALVGPVPDGLTLDHLCRNRLCVNPDHLEPVTPRENTLRGYGRGALQARRTHCPLGHPYSGRNLGGTARHRLCRACVALHAHKRYVRAKAIA